ncbi:MAG: tetratricopeptide repeat protein, partial [Actinobacteria bacterium]|nr:tetratricopeptide repeat protein [Actinomycetota bacterium]
VTFLFTDIEGSTRIVSSVGEEWVPTLERHDTLVAGAVEEHGGVVVKNEGDAFFAVFTTATDALGAAVEAQRRLNEEPWPETAQVRVRMGIHTGSGTLGGADYVGIDVHRAARITDAAHGGQVVMSEPTASLVERILPPGVTIADLGKHRLKDLSDPETIFQVMIPGLPSEFPPLRTLDAIPNNLPNQVTSFVGRERELALAKDLMKTSRVLTLTGPGGTGKTRLALQVAAEISDEFSDGVFFVDLSWVRQVEVVPSAILNAIGTADSDAEQSAEERLVTELRPISVLIVLDNFEQVLGAAPVVAAILRGAPKVKLIVTSRAPLPVSGQQELPVPPLTTGEITDLEEALHSDGVRLLVDRAMAVRPDFALTPANARAAVELVNSLDGLPLAIELVASRLRLFSIETILERLDSRMLSHGSVDMPERQQTIEATIGWSYDLLDPGLQGLFARLAAFSGGARLDEIEVLMSVFEPEHDLIEGLTRLVDNSLVIGGEMTGRPWFSMLQVIHQFAHARLVERGEIEPACQAHLRVFVDLAKRAAPELTRKDRLNWLDVLEANHDNFRAALEWGMERQRADEVLELVAALWRFWQARGHLHEAQWRIEAALALPGGEVVVRARAIEALGGVQWWRGDLEGCSASYVEALEMQRRLGVSTDLARALYNYGLVAGFHLGDYEASERSLEESEEISRSLGDEGGLGDIAWARGNNAMLEERFDLGFSLFLEAAEHYRRAGNEFGVGWALFEVGDNSRRSGQASTAWPYLEEALTLFAGHRDVSGLVMILFLMAGVAYDLGDPRRAYRLAGGADALRKTSGVDIVRLEFNAIAGLEAETLASLTGEEAAAFEEGTTMSVENLVAYGLSGPVDKAD